MSNKRLPYVFVAVAIVIAIVLLAFPVERDWHWARWTGTVEAYESFLARYPDSGQSAAAAQTLHVLREEQEWMKLSGTSSTAALGAFLSEFPASKHRDGAQTMLRSALVRTAASGLAADKAQAMGKSAEELAGIAMSALTQRPASVQDYQLALAVLAKYVAHPDAAALRVSFAALKPSSGAGWLDNAARALQPHMQFVKLGGVEQPTVDELEAAYVPQGGRIVDSVFVVRGRWPLAAFPVHPLEALTQSESSVLRKKNFVANVAFDGRSLFSELPNERIYVTPFAMEYVGIERGGLEPMRLSSFGLYLPQGAGSTYRFKGTVSGVLLGHEVTGDASYPLAFVLLEGAGLTYLCGNGTVTRDKKSWQFPPSAEPPAR